MKFRHIATGIIEEPHNSKVIEQYQKSELYQEIEELPQATKPVVALKDYAGYTLKELKKEADTLGLTYRNKATKSELIAILNGTN